MRIRAVFCAILICLLLPNVAAAKDQLPELRNYRGFVIGPAKSVPPGFVCKVREDRCHCDSYNLRFGVSIGGIGPSKQCGIEGYHLLDDEVRVPSRKEPFVAAREFRYSRKEIVGRYGAPTYFGTTPGVFVDKKGNLAGTHYVYCTRMNAKPVNRDELDRRGRLLGGGEVYQYAFEFAGNRLEAFSMDWADHCDLFFNDGPPIP
jgi:hypothetical protein